MRKKYVQNKKGFAVLYVMLMVAAITTAFTLGISNELLFAWKRVNAGKEAAEARLLAMRCAETLLMQVRNAPGSNSSGTLTVAGGTCVYSITGSVPTKTITIIASKKNMYRRLTITTTAIFPVIVSRWVEGS